MSLSRTASGFGFLFRYQFQLNNMLGYILNIKDNQSTSKLCNTQGVSKHVSNIVIVTMYSRC